MMLWQSCRLMFMRHGYEPWNVFTARSRQFEEHISPKYFLYYEACAESQCLCMFVCNKKTWCIHTRSVPWLNTCIQSHKNQRQWAPTSRIFNISNKNTNLTVSTYCIWPIFLYARSQGESLCNSVAKPETSASWMYTAKLGPFGSTFNGYEPV